MFIDLEQHFKTPKRLQKKYKGIVVDNFDPLRIGRVKCYIEGMLELDSILTDNIDDDVLPEDILDLLPWIYPQRGPSIGSSAISGGAVPEVGSELIIEFPYGNFYSLFYTGEWSSISTSPVDLQSNYPHTYGIGDGYGFKFLFNKATGVLQLTHPSGSGIEIDSEGSVKIRSKNKVSFISTSSFTEHNMDLSNGEITKTTEVDELKGGKTSISSNQHQLTTGKVTEEVAGREVTNTGGHIEKIGGSSSKSINGNSNLVVVGEENTLVGGSSSVTYGAGKEEIVTLGDALAYLLLGNSSLEVEVGNITRKITTGNYSCSVTAGNISLNTSAGSIDLSNTLSSFTIGEDGSLKITLATTAELTASVQAVISAPLVKLGSGVSESGVLTQLSSPVVDNITGAPTIGSLTVLASI